MSFLDSLPEPFFILAPMDDVTDTVFRRMIRGLGGCGRCAPRAVSRSPRRCARAANHRGLPAAEQLPPQGDGRRTRDQPRDALQQDEEVWVDVTALNLEL